MTSDGNGFKRTLHFDHPPQRVVSLVPSMTESMFDLGLGSALVGITDYCVYPQGALQGLPRLGGPKNPRVEDILALQPDLVLANMEENTRQAVEAMEAHGLQVWVTFPKTVREALDVLWLIAGVFSSRSAALRIETLEVTVDWCESSLGTLQPLRYFCPIWMEAGSPDRMWWMTFNSQTYANDVLRLSGGENTFADRTRLYPLAADLGVETPEDPRERDTRYPRLSLQEIHSANPELILLPSEPFPFDEAQRQQVSELFADTRAVQEGQVYLVDGSLITWHGTRLARALQILPGLFSN